MLVGERERDSELPEFGDHVGDRKRGEALELVYVDVERSTGFFGGIGAAHGSKAEGRHKKRSKEVCAVLPEPSLGEIDHKDLPIVHDRSEAQRGGRSGQDTAEYGVSQKGPDLVLYGSDHLLPVPRVVALELFRPEPPDLLVLHLADYFRPEAFFGEHAQDVRQGVIASLDQGKEGVTEHMLHAYSPGFIPELLEGFEEARDGERDAGWVDTPQRVVAIRLALIRGVEVDQLAHPMLWDRPDEPLCQVAVRINETEATPMLHVLDSERLKER